jgi:hypothetical protein
MVADELIAERGQHLAAPQKLIESLVEAPAI